ncbi:MAG TPA: cytochrome c-type biogenesis CcmF C-terminal domain-containing protein [Acidimicrobiia bacterium]|nr:cytochrome c-type biogenesis CcmF C-terminal domain-containing protein [Acidimicrobiia bacterium]
MNAGSIGLLALWGSVAASGLAVVARWLAPTKTAAVLRILGVATILASAATLALAIALLGGDFSLDYVARTTSLATPWPYRLAALWGAMEGSLLFYAALTLLIGWIAGRRLDAELAPVASQVVAAAGFGLLLLTVTMASPFALLDVPAVDGQGLLAILQHPAMVYHPPILYLGLTSLVVPFAVTVAAISRRRIDRRWVRITRRWLLMSWALLTVGMVAGANWAYVELGWGGFWAWDPVENTSLMPWLAVTVFLHTSRVQERDGRLVRWNAGFALLPFVLTLLGVYLTRSGATGSIHAFAESPVIGRILLAAALAGVALAVWLTMQVGRGEPWERASPLARDTWLAANGGLVTIALVFVTVGSGYPAYLQVFADEQALVRPAFFLGAVVPIALLLAVGLAFAFTTRWVPIPPSWARIGGYALVAFVAGWSAVAAFETTPTIVLALFGLAVASVIVLSFDLIRGTPSGRALVGQVAHLGMALVLVGGAGSSLGEDFTAAMGPGETADLARYTIELETIETGEADRFIYVAVDVSFSRSGVDLFTLSPEIRAYEDQALPVPEPALRTTLVEDVVVAISRVAGDASVVEVSVFVRPLVMWVWVGAALIALAGLIALVSTGADGARRRRLATEEQQTAGTTTSS